jgi:translocation and assembly module TamB
MKRFLKIIFRILGWSLAGLIVLLCLAMLLLQTQPVKQRIARIAEQQTNSFLNAKLKIGELSGNFFSHIHLSRVSLTQKQDTLVSIDELDLHYALWPLLKKQIVINRIGIAAPAVHLVRLNDSIWNMSTLVKEQSAPADTGKNDAPFNWQINLKRLELTSGLIRTTTTDSLIPRKIAGINIHLDAKYSNRKQELNLDTLRFRCFQPDFSLKQLTFKLGQADGTVSLSQSLLQTNQNKLNGEGRYAENKKSVLDLQTEPLVMDEFQFVLPDLKLKVHPRIKWLTELKNDQMESDISLTNNEQRIDLSIRAYPFTAWLYKPDSVNLQYSLNGTFDKVKVEEWSGIADLEALLNGTLQVQGEGTDPKTLKAQIKADIQNTSFDGYKIEQLTTQNDYQAGNLHTKINLKTNFADLSATAKIRDLMDKPVYEARLRSSVFSLSPFIAEDSLDTRLNLRLSLSGSGFDPKQMKSQIQLLIDPSTVMGIPVDTAFASLNYNNQQIVIDSLFVQNQSAEITAKGTYNLAGQSDLNLNTTISSLDAFKTFLPDTTDLMTDANIQAHLFGTPDSLKIQANAELQNSKYEDFKVEKANLQADGRISTAGFEFKTALNAQHFSGSGFALDSVAAESTIHNDSLELKASVRNQFFDTKMNAGVNWAKELKIKLNSWLLSIYDQQWQLQHPTQLVIDSTSYSINQFNLVSGNNETINIDGVFNQQGALDLHLNIDQLNLQSLLQPLESDAEIQGLAQLDLTLSGTAQLPVIDSHLKINSLTIAGFESQQAEASLQYQDRKLNIESELALNEQGDFSAKGSMPLLIDLSEMKTSFSSDSLIHAKAAIKDLPLALIQPFIHASEVSGLINGTFQFEGSLNSPKPSGNLQLDNGTFKLDEFGIDYRKMEFQTAIGEKTIRIDTLGITTDDGKLTGGGELDFDSVFYKGRVTKSTLNIHFDKFNPIDHRQINMQLSGDANVSGKKDTIVFRGDLSVPQSEIYLPALLNLFGKVYTSEIPTPILVQELEKQPAPVDSIRESLPPIEFSDSLGRSSASHVIGRIKLKIPKNTWVKDQNFRVELSGDLEILKNPDHVEIFGSVSVVRGQYELFGRTFIVSEGTVTFEGGETIDPRLQLTATYTIKNRDAESKTLELTLGGTALEPTISFTLDDENITEGDALSYVIFGRGLNELSVSEQDNVSEVTGETMAKSAAASLLASQLTRFLGSKINVDYIEVKSQDDFDNASLEVGKYLTSDIFVSYEQQFGNSTDDDLSRYEVKLEYEIFRFLFLQLNNSSKDSGFDVIFKFQAK